MSLHKRSRRRRHFRPFLVAGIAAMTVTVSSVSARAWSHSSARARIATAGHAQLAAATGAGKVLGGLTSQYMPVIFRIANDGRRIDAGVAGLVMSCSLGDGGPVNDAWIRVPINAHGKVHAGGGIPPSGGGSVMLTGGSHSLTGRFNRARTEFVGVWQLHLTLQENGQTDQCDSGRVRFNATL
jgi:hypothetical protein